MKQPGDGPIFRQMTPRNLVLKQTYDSERGTRCAIRSKETDLIEHIALESWRCVDRAATSGPETRRGVD